MATDLSLPVQKAVYDAVVAAVSPVAVYDDPPDKAAFDYLVIGDDTATDAGTKTFTGQELTITIHAYARERGAKRVKALLALVYAALHQQTLTIVGGTNVLTRFEFAHSFPDRDGVTRHGVHRYRMVVQAT